MKDSLPVITNAWLQLFQQRVAQPVIRFRGQLLFHIVPSRFGQLFSLNKLNHYFKTAFCIYSGYLCVILQFVWWSEYIDILMCIYIYNVVLRPFAPHYKCISLVLSAMGRRRRELVEGRGQVCAAKGERMVRQTGGGNSPRRKRE